MIETTVIGASGYSGVELVKLLAGHPSAHIKAITSGTFAGRPITDLYPNLLGTCSLAFSDLDVDEAAKSDVVFLALPHGQSMKIANTLKNAGAPKIIDLSGDFRLPADSYEHWYERPHTAPNLLDEAVYGLTELNRDEISEATLVANPGCFPTGIGLAAAPLIAAGAIDTTITANCLTGVSGAGRATAEATHFCRADENATAYKIGGIHQHTPEIENILSAITATEDATAHVSFTPVLAPISRGIYSILTASLLDNLDEETLATICADFYENSPFVHILAPGVSPQLKMVAGSNHCHVGVAVDKRLNKVSILSAIDNLVKGAAGQAVQNMNIMCGLDETAGLTAPGLFP